MKQKSMFKTWLTLAVFYAASQNAYGGSEQPLYIYDSGGLHEMSLEQQAKLVEESGFAGILIEVESDEDLKNLPAQLAFGRPPHSLRTPAVTVRFDFVDLEKEVAETREVVRAIAHQDIDLWVIVGNKNKAATMDDAEGAVGDLVDYASQHGVRTAIYPHSYCLINSIEEALPLVEKLNKPDLSIVMHLTHEMRAGNTNRMREVMQLSAPHISAITISGADTEIDFTTRVTMQNSTIKPLDRGDFDWTEFLDDAKSFGIDVPVTFINVLIADAPSDYLPRSMAAWRAYTDGQN